MSYRMGEDELERRLRAALHSRAAEVSPDPATWQRVVRKAERARRRAWVLAGSGALATVLAIALVVSGVLSQRSQVQFPAAEQQETESADAPAAPSGSGPCGDAALVMVLRHADGALRGSCADGRTVDLGGGPADGPALSADGALLAFERPGASGREVVVRTLADGQERVAGPGARPAFAEDGRLARVVTLGGGAPQVVVTDPAGAPLAEVVPQGVRPGDQVVDLAWDPGADRLTLSLVAPASGLRRDVVVDPSAGTAPPALGLAAFQVGLGGTHVASAPLGGDRYVALARCCLGAGGNGQLDRLQLGVAAYREEPSGYQGPEYTGVVDLSGLGGLDPASVPSAFLLRPVGRAEALAVEGGVRWSPGTQDSFLVGDGAALWLIAADGAATFLADDVTDAAVNPAAFGATEIDAELLARGARPPVSARPDTQEVEVYFADAQGADCTDTIPVSRAVPVPRLAEGALEALLGGPTADEQALGATSVFSEDTRYLLRDLSLQDDGTLVVDLEDPARVLSRPTNPCETQALVAQMDATLEQFPNVRRVRYQILGDELRFDRFVTPPPSNSPARQPTVVPTLPGEPESTTATAGE